MTLTSTTQQTFLHLDWRDTAFSSHHHCHLCRKYWSRVRKVLLSLQKSSKYKNIANKDTRALIISLSYQNSPRLKFNGALVTRPWTSC